MLDTFSSLADTMTLGGPVLLILLALSIVAVTLVILKLMQFRLEKVGQHQPYRAVIGQWDKGEGEAARKAISSHNGHLARLMRMAFDVDNRPDTQASAASHKRLEAEAEQEFLKLEGGLRFLDILAQIAPLMGLFGTVLGMIEAFQALQSAGSNVDPSVLAGGIWVALLTTAAGLAVAMPVSMALAWLEAQLDKDRAMAELILSSVAAPLPQQGPHQDVSQGERV